MKQALDLWVQLATPPQRTEDGVPDTEQVRRATHHDKRDRNETIY